MKNPDSNFDKENSVDDGLKPQSSTTFSFELNDWDKPTGDGVAKSNLGIDFASTQISRAEARSTHQESNPSFATTKQVDFQMGSDGSPDLSIEEEMSFLNQYDIDNPSAWDALRMDQSLPLSKEVREAYIQNASSKTRQFLLPVLRPFLHLLVGLIQLIKIVTPQNWAATAFLHKCIAWGLHTFVRPDANFLILRHFHLGTQILDFLCKNLDCPDAPLKPLNPKTVFDLQPNVVLQHDINLYNFVVFLNLNRNLNIQKKEKLDLSDIFEPELKISDFPNNWSNFLDVETAMEAIAPLFQLLTTDSDYWRASISLQLDETIALYVSRLLGQPERMSIVNNKHPLVANNIVEAPRRLMMHGLSTEMAHQTLIRLKKK